MNCLSCGKPMALKLVDEAQGDNMTPETYVSRTCPGCQTKFNAELEADRIQVAGRITRTLQTPLRKF